MTDLLWSQAPNVTVADDAETVVATLVVPNVNVNEAIALSCNVFVGNPDGDAGGSVIRIRRTNLAGVIVGTCGDTGNSGTSQADAPTLTGPFFDGPGLAGTITYVLTLAMTDATGPSAFIAATLGASYN